MLTSPRVDTNSLYLAAQLNGIGVEVVLKSVVGDHQGRLAEAVRRAAERCPIVILSGGLGPTLDDLTREAVAEALGRPPARHANAATAAAMMRSQRRFGKPRIPASWE